MRSFEELSDAFWDDKRFEDIENIKIEDYDEYLNELNQILENDSSNIEAIKLKIFILYCQNKYEESVAVCDFLLRKRPDDIEILNDKVSGLFQLARYKEVIEACQKILEIDPENKDAKVQWDSALVMSDDNTLPKPPETLLSKIVKLLIIITIFVAIILYLLKLS